MSTCQPSPHLPQRRRPAAVLDITLLEAANSPEEAKTLEVQWTRRLFAFKPTGLNIREEAD